MVKKFKKKFYFLVASYFVFWASLVLKKWRPRIVVVTGSTGKTTLFYLLQAQLGEAARFAYDANSTFGIPFDILGLKRKTLQPSEWLALFALAPFKALTFKNDRPKIYVVEADADRPREAKILAQLLQPEIVLITNIYQTHAVNFDDLVAQGGAPDVLTAIADEFANFARQAGGEVLLNGDNPALVQAIERLNLPPEKFTLLQEQDYLADYQLLARGTKFTLEKHTYEFADLLPREVALSLVMVERVMEMLGLPLDPTYKNLHLPPGRSNLFAGIKGTTLIDSTYNANLGSMLAMVKLFERYPAAGSKWLVLGHMLEEGAQAKKQHQDLAWAILQTHTIDRVFLLGQENQTEVLPLLEQYWGANKVFFYASPRQALTALKDSLQGGEAIMFKGAPFLEGMVERLLADPEQAKQLVRREEVWQKRRQGFYA